jgi:MYXO-CTERM domain-containing protein
MLRHTDRARRLFVTAGLTAALAAPLGAQANTNTTSTGGVATPMTTDSARTERDDDSDFPWGLLGLLGLAGLLGRRKVETVVHDTTRTTARPGDPNYRV